MAIVLGESVGMTDDSIRQARRLCFFAHYHPCAIVADYVLAYLRELKRAGFTVVVLSTAALSDPERAKLRGACAMLIERDNVGLDFGGWIEAFARFSPIEAELLLLANDSVYGPLHDLSAFIDRLTAVPADFYGAVESWEGGPHLQSWFLLLRPTAYRSRAFVELMTRPVPADLPKIDIIHRYEMALLERLTEEGLRHHAAFSPARGGALAQRQTYNPSQLLWHQLVTRNRIPFIKIELLRDNPRYLDGLQRWRRLAPPESVAMYEDDLAMRSARPFTDRAARWERSLETDTIAYWPILGGLIARDAAPAGPLRRRLHSWVFGRALAIVHYLRWRTLRRRGTDAPRR
jgi:hypothetical protein